MQRYHHECRPKNNKIHILVNSELESMLFALAPGSCISKACVALADEYLETWDLQEDNCFVD